MTPLEHTLAKALTEVVIRLDHSDGIGIAPEATIKMLEPVSPFCRACRSRTGKPSPT
ncbi:hypothetical protein ACWCSD_03530 [Nonomuraea sp. NPDC001684]